MSSTERKHVYFASDFHLGVPSYEKSLVREKNIVAWLDSIKDSALEIFLVGDIFDFWFEYKQVIPKGFVRLQGKIAEITDSGIPVHVFTGNHDMWIFDYLPKELGFELHRKPVERVFGNQKFLIGHGDGLGPGDNGYKFLKRVFENKLSQWIFARLHPNFGIWLANYSSRSSRLSTGNDDAKYLGKEKEWLFVYCNEMLQKEYFDHFIFGHRHLPLHLKLTDNSDYINLGDWLQYMTFAEFDGENLSLKKWDNGKAVDFISTFE